MSSIDKFIGIRIKQLREAANLSAYALSKIAGVAQSTLSEVESGKYVPKIDFIHRICTALGITLADFFAPAGEGAEPLSPELRRLLEKAKELSPEELQALQTILDGLGRKR
ncbi:MAG: helix-turn-helix transcriptional regulator [Peptococcaceae bacterium]|nr:helix-turn-helix transcriptional regulator [Peptococcaceae bacterium]